MRPGMPPAPGRDVKCIVSPRLGAGEADLVDTGFPRRQTGCAGRVAHLKHHLHAAIGKPLKVGQRISQPGNWPAGSLCRAQTVP